ncbi:DUF3267 domain-containing protein [Flammeovirga sp. EKP202]|uniref:DUF3267 domain-containing protein n=1 Tax=Flammeovirga sp. EKP202 TaxID=2770592 RepID=UPI00165FE901|nr:DUF3267 domain-containing protein [Flammeovirga sp. EKP202]MBD0404174.1 DUF3267 domain-containing protein [Flammeovirga sp. EKP202]
MREIRHSEVHSFINDQLKKKGVLLKIYLFVEYIQLFLLIFIIINVLLNCYHQKYLPLFLFGVSIFFSFSILIFIHEVIHYLGYLILGRRDVYFGKVEKQMIFYVTTRASKLNGYEYLFISMLPFILISLVCIFFAIKYHNIELYFFTIPVLVCNYSFSKGDFAFSDYLIQIGISTSRLWNSDNTIFIGNSTSELKTEKATK